MNYFLKQTLILTGLLLLTSFLFAQKTIGEHVDKMGKRYVKKKKNHALVIGIIKDGNTTVRNFGQMSKTDKTAPDGNTVFEIGAATAVFTTTLMQLQADKNRFQQKEPVRDYLDNGDQVPSYYPLKCVEVSVVPDMEMEDNLARGGRTIHTCFEDPLARPQCITFCDLATHISGLPNSPKDWYKWKPMGKTKFGDTYKDGTVEEFFTKLQGTKLVNVPGTKYEYSDYGIALLGNAMSKISKMPYAQLLEQELLNPLGLKHTRIDFEKNNSLRFARGHNSKGKAVPAWNFDGMAPAAGLKSTVNDLLIFANANLKTDNKDLENAFVEVQQNKVNLLFGKSGRVTSVGYGWFTSTLNEETNLPVIWIDGGTGGFRTFIGFIQDSKTAVVILSNSENSVDKMGFDILEVLNAQTVKKTDDRASVNK